MLILLLVTQRQRPPHFLSSLCCLAKHWGRGDPFSSTRAGPACGSDQLVPDQPHCGGGGPCWSCGVVGPSVSGGLASSGLPCPAWTFPHLADPKLTASAEGQCSIQGPRRPVSLRNRSCPVLDQACSPSRVYFSGPEAGRLASYWSRTTNAGPGRSCSGHPRTPPGHVAPVPLLCGHYGWETKAHGLP